MRVLLDTHTFIWFVTGNRRISTTAREIIEDENNEKFLSVASIWEMAIKYSTGKLSFNLPFEVFILLQLSINNFSVLDIQIRYTAVVATLPFHHRDPFDRLIIAQAMVEQIPVISVDSVFDSYPSQRLW